MKRRADRPQHKARLKRRAHPIAAYVGPNGSGKSALMMLDTAPSLDNGRPVLSTVRVLDYRDPHLCGERPWDVCDAPDTHDRPAVAVDVRRAWDRDEFRWLPENRDLPPAELDRRYAVSPVIRTSVPTGEIVTHRAAHRLYTPFTHFEQLLDWRDGDCLMDEVTGVSSSRAHAGMPAQVLNYLVQMRRRNVTLRWTAPAWGRADLVIREVTQAVTLMYASMPRLAPFGEDGARRLWTQKRLFEARTYDAAVLEEFTAKKAEKIPHLIRAYYWGPGSVMFSMYDTYDAVSALSHVEAGTCVGCGGRRAQPACKCPQPELVPFADRRHADRVAAVVGRLESRSA